MKMTWTETQKNRLVQLGAEAEIIEQAFDTLSNRDRCFQEYESKLVNKQKLLLLEHKNQGSRPVLEQVESQLVNSLCSNGFCQVSTPIIISASRLEKMTITADSPLAEQVFWLDNNKCLRPMLAPNLYSLMKDLHRVWDEPVRFFEVGPCFRKESQGKHHLNEFTMLNLVEMGVLEGQQSLRLEELIGIVMDAVGISDYTIEKSESEVYGETVDVVYQGLELCSGAYGPHRLDHKWGIFTPWVGLGIGLERLAMVLSGHKNIKQVGRSLSYLYGLRLNI